MNISCKCMISPRYLHFIGTEFSCKKIDFVNVCIECGGSGGNYGNINHTQICKYNQCQHDGSNKSRNIEHELIYGMWGSKQPTSEIRKYHLTCVYTRKNEIETIIKKMSDYIMIKVFAIINIKTGLLLNLIEEPKNYINNYTEIIKWIRILGNKSN